MPHAARRLQPPCSLTEEIGARTYEDPPRAQYNSSPNLYGLPAFYEVHVWAWRDNPNGTSVDWPPASRATGSPLVSEATS